MKVNAIMTHEVTPCAPETSLCEAARTMREIDSGVLPVLRNGKVVGVITDRDICMALGECEQGAPRMSVGEKMSRSVFSCSEEDSIEEAFQTMKAKRVRRLPVLDAKQRLRGMLSMNDVILHAEESGNDRAVSYEDAVRTLQAICEHRYPPRPKKPEDVTELARYV